MNKKMIAVLVLVLSLIPFSLSKSMIIEVITIKPESVNSKVSSVKHPINTSSNNDNTIKIDLGRGVVMDMVWIPPGTFQMGQNGVLNGSIRADVHTVTLTKGFWLGKYEVTQSQWRAIIGTNPASRFGVGSDYPVYNISWNDITNKFIPAINHINMHQGKFRLPTEAEWEYACRAGSTTTYYWGNDASEDVVKQYCWYAINAYSGTWTVPHADWNGLQAVGQKLPNVWGLYDMCGNSWEACSDWLGDYKGGAETDPSGAASGVYRVFRGGGWGTYDSFCRSAYRHGIGPSNISCDVGFRLVMDAAATPPE